MKVQSFPLSFLLLMFVLIASLSCSKSQPDEKIRDTTPGFLLKGWILPIASNVVRTYDFTQMQAAGKRTVEIRAWQQIGTLGWQSNQLYTAIYEATDKQVVMTSPTGYREVWDIISVEPTKILVNLNGQQTYIFNCSEPGWPTLVKASMRGCR
ncbi:MAG: hypothetical protein ICV51_18980 [Flavisolibacter sp.]|nr:hypothetical protein [Flavisolibacter sp.]